MIYETFDTLPVLNWYLLNKNNDLHQLKQSSDSDIEETELYEAYDKLLLADGGIEFKIPFLFGQCIKLLFELIETGSAKIEDDYHNTFDKYISALQKEVEEDVVSFWNQYFEEVGFEKSLKNGILKMDYHNFTFKNSGIDLFLDISKISTVLGYQIDPAKTSVNHYKALVKQANTIAQQRSKKK